MQAPRKEVDSKIVYMCYRPASVEVLWCWSHTAAAGLSSGSHVSDADGVFHSSVSCPPEQQTARNNQKTPSGLNTSLIPLILTKLPDRGSDLFDLLSVLLWCSCASDPQALFKHRHTGLGFTALDLGQPSSFLCLPVLHLLYQPLVITLHLLHLLMTHRVGITMSGYKTYQSLIHWID